MILNTIDFISAADADATAEVPFKLYVTASVGLDPRFTNGIKIYPNHMVTHQKRLEINLERHTSGMYILKATGPGFDITHKIILKTSY